MNPGILSMLGVAAVLFSGTVMVLMQRLRREEKIAARVLSVQNHSGVVVAEAAAEPTDNLLVRVVRGIGELIMSSGLLSRKTIEALQMNLRIAGFRDRGALGLLVGAKLVMLLSFPAILTILLDIMGWQPPMAEYLPFAAAIAGLLAPDYVVRALRKSHLKALERGLPDALDLLVICSEAGLGLEPGLERVGLDVRQVHRAVSDELMHTSQELRINSDRRAALLNMGSRTGVENLRRLGATLVQTMQYGTPLSQALRVLSAEMRTEALTAFESRAGRLPVLLTLPMVIFILPCVFMIVGGPAMVQVFQTLRH